MRRREFIAALAGIAGSWPRVVTAQPQRSGVPVIGWLSSGSRYTDDTLRLPYAMREIRLPDYFETAHIGSWPKAGMTVRDSSRRVYLTH